MKNIVLFLTSIVFYNIDFINVNFNDLIVLKIVNEWNRKTILSLKNNVSKSVNISDKNRYKNRLSVVPQHLRYKGGSTSYKSIRYKLLKDVLLKNRNFYIVEADRSGEQIEIVSYLILYREKVADVTVYNYTDGRWVSNYKHQTASLKFNEELRKEIVDRGRGVNEDDVIISKFVDKSVVSSEYFLDYTLSGDSGINKILEMR